MRKIRKSMAAIALSMAMITTAAVPWEPAMVVHAEVTPDSSISLADTSEVTADTSESVLRIYGDGSTVYDVPINVTVNCTVLLDNISTTADLTVADGVTATIVIRGNCSLGNIVAVGGVRTNVKISGEDDTATLTTGNIAQAKPGQLLENGFLGDPEMSAYVDIEDCTVICDNIGCGSDGLAGSVGEDPYASDAGSASAIVTIRRATVHASGSIACGGNGASEIGDSSYEISDGGRSGDVVIALSHVTVGGCMSIGGKGGNGSVTGTNNTVTSGDATSPGIVTILNNSVVEVTGDVATAPDLADESYWSTTEGLYGGTVVVDKSTLTCRDIASGGRGIEKSYYSVTESATTYYGTDGGSGGVLIAKDAVIHCETACNGGEAGDYFKQPAGQEPSYDGHPRDGHGGRIEATNSQITITDSVCKRAMKWDGYGGNQSYHNRPSFIGGSLTGGKVYGADIITDVTALFDCELMADYAVVNSEGTSASKCIIDTSDEMAKENVFVTANTVSGSAILNESGQLVTYLATGTNEVKIAGTKTFVGSCLVDTNPVFNIFSLEEESTTEMPDDGEEETSGTGGEETPGTGGEETPGTGEEETPSTGGEEETPGTGGEETPGTGGEETPGTGEVETPGTGGEETPGTGGEETPSTGEVETPGTGGEETPGTGSEETPPVTEYEMVISTNVPGIAVTVLVGDQTLDLEADEDGKVKFTIAADVTEFYVIVDAVKYYCLVTDGTPGGLTIIGPTAVLSGNDALKEGDPLQLTVDAVPSIESNTLSYAWYKDDTLLAVTGSALVISQAALSDAGSYYVVVTESNGQSVTTAAIAVSVDVKAENGSESGDSSGEVTGGDPGSSSGGSSGGTTGDSSGGSNGGSSGVSSGGSFGGSSGGSSGVSSGGSSGGTSGGSSGGSSGGASNQTPVDHPEADPSGKPEDAESMVTAIQMKSNLKGISLLPTSAKNTYQKYFAKTVKLTVSKEPGYTYYYKVVEKGKANSTVRWKKLTGNVIKVAASDTAKRIYIRAVDQNGTSVTRKTSGFYVDSKKPIVKGVKNKAVYTKPVKIRFSDNISVKSASLNGKKIASGYKVSKNGTYRLVVTDRAGNKTLIRFTIRK